MFFPFLGPEGFADILRQQPAGKESQRKDGYQTHKKSENLYPNQQFTLIYTFISNKITAKIRITRVNKSRLGQNRYGEQIIAKYIDNRRTAIFILNCFLYNHKSTCLNF